MGRCLQVSAGSSRSRSSLFGSATEGNSISCIGFGCSCSYSDPKTSMLKVDDIFAWLHCLLTSFCCCVVDYWSCSSSTTSVCSTVSLSGRFWRSMMFLGSRREGFWKCNMLTWKLCYIELCHFLHFLTLSVTLNILQLTFLNDFAWFDCQLLH